MTTHSMRPHPQPFRDIATGRKTWEFRLNDKKRRAINVGDEIEFENRGNPGEKIAVIVEELKQYPDFARMFDDVSEAARENCPRDEWVASFREYYSEDEERKDGTLAIRFKMK